MGKTMKIPKTFKLFGTTVNVVWDNGRMNDKNIYGLCDSGKNEIVLSTVDGVVELSNDTMLDTFYHEKIHCILDAMNEGELSGNEKFVEIFSKLLRQADESAKY